MKKIFALLVLGLTLVNPILKADNGIQFVHDKSFQEILDMAKAQNRYIFMDCYTSWCGPCKRLAAQVFPDSSVGEFFNSTFINAKFDMEKGEGPSIAGKYGVSAYPTLLWIDGNGEVKHKIVGGLDINGLIANGKKVVDPTPGILTGMRKEYTDGKRDVGFLSDFLNTLSSANQPYGDVFKEYLGKLTPKDLSDAKHSKTIFNLTDDIKSPGMDFLLKDKDYYSGVMSPEVMKKKIYDIANKTVKAAYKANDVNMFNSALELVKNFKAADSKQKTLELSMDYYLHMSEWENYDKSASEYIKKYASKNATVLNDVAWNYYINVNNTGLLQKALKWSYEAVTLDNKYTNNLTYAYIRYKLNDYDEAEKACDYAIIRAKEENIQPTSASALKDAIQKSISKRSN